MSKAKSAYDIYLELRRELFRGGAECTFTVTGDHLKLLRLAWVDWEDAEFGAPAIDPKRPYGNSDVLGDIAEALEVPEATWRDGDYEAKPEYEQRFIRLHAETAIALQICLRLGTFEPGTYKGSLYGSQWERVPG